MSSSSPKPNILVSIVVPIYNVEKYVQACIDSLIAQSYANIEILLIDDGSTDHSGDLCDKAATQDTRIVVLHKRNGGLSDARNTGIRKSHGQYIALIDGDDYVHKDFIKVLLASALERNADIAACSYIRMYSDGVNAQDAKSQDFAEFSNVQAIRDMVSPDTLCDVVAWNKLYKTKLFKENGVKYPLGKIHEDTFTTYKLLYRANKVVFTNTALYHYVQRTSSIMGVGYTRKNLAMVEAIDEMMQWAHRERLSLRHEIFHFRLSKTLYLISRMTGTANATPDDWKDLSSWIARNKREALFGNGYVNRMQKIVICFVLLGERPYAFMRWLLRHTPGYSLKPN